MVATTPRHGRDDAAARSRRRRGRTGAINTILNLPALYGYAAVIFSAPVFGPYAATLAKSVVVSSAVHQAVFVLLSTLPFAIGQVQDAGLIFLSQMATTIANELSDEPAEDVVATTLVGLCLATSCLGLCVVAVGRARLTYLVGYLPMPVLGGYLQCRNQTFQGMPAPRPTPRGPSARRR